MKRSVGFKIFSNGMSRHGFFLSKSGKLFGYGKNENKQVLEGSSPQILSPIPIPLPKGCRRVKSVGCGYCSTVILFHNGELYSRGENDHGECGLGSVNSVPVLTKIENFGVDDVRFMRDLEEVRCGYMFSWVRSKSGRCYSTGRNDDGQLGLGDYRQRREFEKNEYFGAKNKRIGKVEPGGHFTLFLTTVHEVYSSGCNTYRQCMQPGSVSKLNVPTLIQQLDRDKLTGRVVQIAAGIKHCMFIIKEGSRSYVLAAGNNRDGQLGTKRDEGACDSVDTPFGSSDDYDSSDESQNHTRLHRVTGLNLTNPIFIACGYHHSVVATRAGVYGFGYNEDAEVGRDPGLEVVDFVSEYTLPEGLVNNLVQIIPGGNETVFVNSSGCFYGCGYNGEGFLMDGSGNQRESVGLCNKDFVGDLALREGFEFGSFFASDAKLERFEYFIGTTKANTGSNYLLKCSSSSSEQDSYVCEFCIVISHYQ